MLQLILINYYLGLIKGKGPDPVNKKADPDPDRIKTLPIRNTGK
jgi:hypothetical protein